MSLETHYRSLVSGQWQGPLAAALRGSLAVLEQPYRWAVAHRMLRFDQEHVQAHKVTAPVISVGNLTVGGTGKTPFVAWLARWFTERGTAVTIISRGYGSKNGRPNDEALELAAQLPDIPHLQNRDRVAAAQQALRANPEQVLILDDAFQHRRLARDLDIVLLDALTPFGYERMLPRGLLREPPAALARAQIIALSRSDAVDDRRRQKIRSRARELAPHAIWLELVHRPRRLVSAEGETLSIEKALEKPCAAFCGIGNPQGFRTTLESVGLRPTAWLELPDHCSYDVPTLRRIERWLKSASEARQVLCTRKDLVKIPRGELAGKPLWALEISLELASGQAELEAKLAALSATVTTSR